METTSLSLLDRAKSDDQTESWNQLVSIYQPVLKNWLKTYSMQDADADDLVQETLAAAFKDLGKFEHNGQVGAFRKWLKTILVYRLKYFWRSRKYRPTIAGGTDFNQHLQELEDPESPISKMWNQEHDRVVLQQVWKIVSARFNVQTKNAFEQYVKQGKPAKDVAQSLGMTVNAVMIAKSRVLKAMRQECQGLVD